jgi:hypothetical protein
MPKLKEAESVKDVIRKKIASCKGKPSEFIKEIYLKKSVARLLRTIVEEIEIRGGGMN